MMRDRPERACATAVVGLLALAFSTSGWAQGSSRYAGPIIDMHMHAFSVGAFGEGQPICPGDQWKTYPGVDPGEELPPQVDLEVCPNPLPLPESDEALLRQTQAMMERFNISGVISGDPELTSKWNEAIRGRLIRAQSVPDHASVNLDAVRRLVTSGEIGIIGEIWPQSMGLRPDAPELDPILALAEELGVPVGIHMGLARPGDAYYGTPAFRSALGNPLFLEEALVRHPRLRLYVMHAGYPFLSEMIALLHAHPQVYAEIALLNWYHPRPAFLQYLRGLIDAGFGRRILFGTDFVVWPDAIPIAIDSIEAADFLTADQRADIFFYNATRFLRLNEEEIEGYIASANRG